MNDGLFSRILQRNGCSEHDGRPMWKYRCTDEEYAQLKKLLYDGLRMNRISISREAVLFVAEWWKREYKEGAWRWVAILESLGLSAACRKPLEELCHTGMRQLGIKPIKLINTHFLAALLVQGGLPVRKICEDETLGSFTIFLKLLLRKVERFGLEQAAQALSDGEGIVQYLPKSFLTESAFLDLALQIVDAIVKEDNDRLPFDVGSSNKLKEMVETLKRDYREKSLYRFPFRISWMCDVLCQTPVFYYRPELAGRLNEENLNAIQVDVGNKRIKVLLEGCKIGEYKKSTSDEYIQISPPNSRIRWLGQETLDFRVAVGEAPSECLSDVPGITAPDLTLPILMNGDTLSVEFSGSTRSKEAFVLVPSCWSMKDITLENGARTVNLDGNSFKLLKFAGDLELSSDTDSLIMRAGIPLDEVSLSVSGKIPDWILGSNTRIIAGRPAFSLISEDASNPVQENSVEWRYCREGTWKKWQYSATPCGCIEFRIAAGSSFLRQRLFLLGGNCDLAAEPKGARAGKIVIANFAGSAAICGYGTPALTGSRMTFNINLATEAVQPAQLELILEAQGNHGTARVQIAPPFRGAYFCGPDGEILRQSAEICVGQGLHSYRLICVGDSYKLIIRSEDNNWNDLHLEYSLAPGTYALWEYEEKVISMLNLGKPLSSAVKLDVVDCDGTPKRTLVARFYNVYGDDATTGAFSIYDNSNNKVDEDGDLQAFLLSESASGKSSVPVVHTDEGWTLPANAEPGLWIAHGVLKSGRRLSPKLLEHRSDEISVSEMGVGNALAISDKEQRRKALSATLNGEGVYGSAWPLVTHYLRVVANKRLAFSVLDIFNCLAKDNVLVARCVIACAANPPFDKDEYLFDALAKMEEELPIAWHLIPLAVWREELARFQKEFDSQYSSGIISRQVIDSLWRDMFIRLNNFFQNLSDVSDWAGILLTLIQNPARHFSIQAHIDHKWFDYLKATKPTQKWWPSTGTFSDLPEEYANFGVDAKVEFWQRDVANAPVKSALIVAGKIPPFKHSWQIARLRSYRNFAPDWYDRVFAHTLQRLFSK